MKWIKASERLPEESGEYFCKAVSNNSEIRALRYFAGSRFLDDRFVTCEWLDETPESAHTQTGRGEQTREQQFKEVEDFNWNYSPRWNDEEMCRFVNRVEAAPEKTLVRILTEFEKQYPRPTQTEQDLQTAWEDGFRSGHNAQAEFKYQRWDEWLTAFRAQKTTL
jgi:hypothetical protein